MARAGARVAAKTRQRTGRIRPAKRLLLPWTRRSVAVARSTISRSAHEVARLFPTTVVEATVREREARLAKRLPTRAAPSCHRLPRKPLPGTISCLHALGPSRTERPLTQWPTKPRSPGRSAARTPRVKPEHRVSGRYARQTFPKGAVIKRIPVLGSCHGLHTHAPVDTCFHCDRQFAQFQINVAGPGHRQLRSSVEVVSDAKRVARFTVGGSG